MAAKESETLSTREDKINFCISKQPCNFQFLIMGILTISHHAWSDQGYQYREDMGIYDPGCGFYD